jgi:Na+/melibiose symporter-like transporter
VASRGAAYGLRQSLDTIGGFLGPLAAIALMLLFAGDFHAVFWVAVIPGIVSVALLVFGIHEAERAQGVTGVRPPLALALVKTLPPAYWWVVLAGAVFTLARFSEAFLLLRAQQQGLPDAYAPLVLVLMNAVFALTAYPMGRLSDRVNPMALLAAGLGVLVCADIALALSPGLAVTAAGIARLFSTIVAAGDTPQSKPSPAPYQLAFDRLQASAGGRLDPRRCVAIEDSRWGLDSARGAGLRHCLDDRAQT